MLSADEQRMDESVRFYTENDSLIGMIALKAANKYHFKIRQREQSKGLNLLSCQ